MKYRAPAAVTALFVDGEAVAPDQAGVFEAAREWFEHLAAHGCVALGDEEPGDMPASAKPSRRPARADKAQ